MVVNGMAAPGMLLIQTHVQTLITFRCNTQMSTAEPRLAVLDASYGFAAAHFKQAQRRPAALFRGLGGALTEFLLLLAPRYGRTRARAAIERGVNTGAGCEELQMSLLFFGVVCIVLCFFPVHYKHTDVELTCGVLLLTVN